ncbi:hypothetical protein CIRMBP1233_00605 [Enterococcus cecorum]|nr:hypothetical protein CIRMBP1219_00444 [Enterococcus cecorum]CAI3285146.1 hypothetical protein CIRMBP1216_00484 [Enterococcus cecorum]CAI3291088.1 hypothetical protein CIRMBP1208_00459 [Enterococcus cecorum]CAI3293851.1 hypothetical protein CIRMBP1213_00577 [Enterococcus cecorum]CAI3293965.1 hypothetical protein CIRMBP1233_00605 [Enterococcus cecorum]
MIALISTLMLVSFKYFVICSNSFFASSFSSSETFLYILIILFACFSMFLVIDSLYFFLIVDLQIFKMIVITFKISKNKMVFFVKKSSSIYCNIT